MEKRCFLQAPGGIACGARDYPVAFADASLLGTEAGRKWEEKKEKAAP